MFVVYAVDEVILTLASLVSAHILCEPAAACDYLLSSVEQV